VSHKGTGYHIEIKVADDDEGGREKEREDPVQAFMHEQFPNALLLEQHGSKYHYELSTEDSHDTHQLATIFSVLQEHKEDLRIEDYSVSQPTLEQIFLKLTKQETEDDDAHLRKSKCRCYTCCCCFTCCCK